MTPGSASPSPNIPSPFQLPDTPGPSAANIQAIKKRQMLILHRLNRVRTSLATLGELVAEVRHGLHVQNDKLHKVELHLESISHKYLDLE